MGILGLAPGPWRERCSSPVVCVSAPLGFEAFEELQLQRWVSLSSALWEFPLWGVWEGGQMLKPGNVVRFG